MNSVSYKHFITATCEFLPCHALADWKSCLFCYCPRFLLACPGDFRMLPTGFKDCSQCVLPHTEESWDIIQNELQRQLYHQGHQPNLP